MAQSGVQIYPRRGAVPPDLGNDCWTGPEASWILVYGCLFRGTESTVDQKPYARKRDWRQVEILLGDPDSDHVAERGADEGIGNAMAGKIRNVLTYCEELPPRRQDWAPVSLMRRFYNSIYRFNDEMLVNTHLFATPAAYAPTMHLRRLAGSDLFDAYGKLQQVTASSRSLARRWYEAATMAH
jgi:hypothetical protein